MTNLRNWGGRREGAGRKEGSTNDLRKMFKNAVNSRFTEDDLTHNIQEAKISMQRWVFDLALTKPELILKEFNQSGTEESLRAQALLDKLRTETDDNHHVAMARIKDLELSAQLKEKELHGVSEDDIPSAGLESPALNQILDFAEAQTRKKKGKK